MRISDWSSDVCSSDLLMHQLHFFPSRTMALYVGRLFLVRSFSILFALVLILQTLDLLGESGKILAVAGNRSEEHTSELQSLMRISYAVFCLKKKNTQM